jgi:hypothetical protein
MIRRYVKHSSTRRGLGSSWINTTRRLPSGRSAWAKVEVRLTAERQAAVLDANLATTTLAGARPLAGGSSHRTGVSHDKPIIDSLRRTCASTSMKAAMRAP